MEMNLNKKLHKIKKALICIRNNFGKMIEHIKECFTCRKKFPVCNNVISQIRLNNFPSKKNDS